MTDTLRTKIMTYLKANSSSHPRRSGPISENEFAFIYMYFNSPMVPPLLNRRKFKRALLYGVENVLEQCSVIVNTDNIDQLTDDIYDEYTVLVTNLEKAEREFNEQKKKFVPDYKKLIVQYISHVGQCEGADFLRQPSKYLTDVERDFLSSMMYMEHK